VVVTNITKHSSNKQPSGFHKAPTPLARAAVQRAGSTRETNIETPHHTNKMHAQFSRIGMPNFYKLDKMTYSRNDISDLANKMSKKMDDLEHMLDYERRKNQTTQREKADL